MGQCGAARTAGNQKLTSELARLCREAIKEDFKERRTEVLLLLVEDAEAEQSICYARWNFANLYISQNKLDSRKMQKLDLRRHGQTPTLQKKVCNLQWAFGTHRMSSTKSVDNQTAGQHQESRVNVN
ncbi:hypothetical protein NECAME_09417 [Necator americanus]|uniref:Uncharacterized protein n=1 Tax=Necator americanus TaxID=51031 RepID=W2TGE8_NECAM|nr:hypothetical protein NECAME_09417 [Necator americanus]ETN80097.1 hypothetical protein NECAME_09417 [Necator americanus]